MKGWQSQNVMIDHLLIKGPWVVNQGARSVRFIYDNGRVMLLQSRKRLTERDGIFLLLCLVETILLIKGLLALKSLYRGDTNH